MPPPQTLLSSTLRGYVCRSCLLRLQAPRRRKVSTTARLLAKNENPHNRKGVWDTPFGTVRYWEQTPDGVRTEIKEDDDELVDILRAKLKDIERRTGRSVEDLEESDLEGIMKEISLESPIVADPNGPYEGGYQETQEDDETEKTLQQIAEQTEEVRSRVDFINSFDLDNLSEQDRIHLREGLMNPGKKDPRAFRSPTGYAISKIPQLVQDLAHRHHNSSTKITFPITAFPTRYHAHLRTLEACVNNNGDTDQPRTRMGRSRRKRSLNTSGETWRAYTMCRSGISSAPHLVPRVLYQKLWDIITHKHGQFVDVLSHVKILGNDMRKADVEMTISQKLLYTEAIIVEEGGDVAVQMWESMGLDVTISMQKEYWELGARMFCQQGKVDEATTCTSKILETFQDSKDFRLLLPLIAAILHARDDKSIHRAWALYIRLKYNLGSKMTMEDYDAIIIIFLNSGHRQQALMAFKDMMLTNNPIKRQRFDSLQRYTKCFGSNLPLASLLVSAEELEWDEFDKVDRLPKEFSNSIFFASWMKKLIGSGDLQPAEQVYQIMLESDIRPSSIAMNGLIGAWYRSQLSQHREKADDLAWQMIRARTAAVTLRRTTLITYVTPEVKLPHATIETFSILLEQYRIRQKFGLIPGLVQALQDAEIMPNVDFMNQLLKLQATQAPETALQTFQSLTNADLGNKAVRPDFMTYRVLWEIAARQISGSVLSRIQKRLICKSIFKSMVDLMHPKQGHLPDEVYQTMILSFCLLRDEALAAMALLASYRHFGNYPTDTTIRAIILQVSRTGLTNESGRGPGRLRPKSDNVRPRVDAITDALTNLKSERADALKADGIDFYALGAHDKKKETVFLLCKLLRWAYENKPGESPRNDAAKISREIAYEFRVPDCVAWHDYPSGFLVKAGL